jgi:ATP-dependent Clp protease, protease subunit
MSLRQLPEAKTFQRPQNLQWDAPSDVLARWAETPMAAAEAEDTITIFDVIGEDLWTGGFTAKRMSAALRSIGDKPVTVQINSPGGDLFEGLAIFNMLRAHKQKVTVQVLGWAASAASIIAMAGDEIVMGLGTFMMVHNAWGIVIGNRHDFREAADLFEGFDGAIVDIYEARTGASRKEIEKLMDAETFMGPSEAVKHGFADRVEETLGGDKAENRVIDPAIMARRRTEAALARAGFTRSQRAEMLSEISNHSPAQRDAGRLAARDAGVDLADIRQFIETLKS